MMRMTFKRATTILKAHYGAEFIDQIWKPTGKNFYIVTFKDKSGEISTTEKINTARIWSLA